MDITNGSESGRPSSRTCTKWIVANPSLLPDSGSSGGTGDKDGPPLETCSLITTDANKLAQEIHDRMPVILDPVDYDAWLNPECRDVVYMLTPFDADRMTAKPVSTLVTSPILRRTMSCWTRNLCFCREILHCRLRTIG